MNTQSGSALQKLNFTLLVLIAVALGYLIARDRRHQGIESETTIPAAGVNVSDEQAIAASPPRPEHAPLRPRSVTNSPGDTRTGLRVVTTNPDATGAPLSDDLQNGLTTVASAKVRTDGAVPVAITPGTRGVPAGRVAGRAVLRGTPPSEKAITLDAVCGRLHPAPMFTRHYLVGEGGGLANVFVYVKNAPKDVSPQAALPVLDNINCEFQPYVLGVRAGQPFTLRNSDPVLHNMHMTTRPGSGNREMNLGMPVRGMFTTKVFQQPEVFIRVKCDVHPWMFAYIGVVAHRWFAVTDAEGNFSLPPGLPPGDYTIAAVHLKAGERTERLEVTERVGQSVNFTFEVPDGSGTP
jgi:hypothetical protein